MSISVSIMAHPSRKAFIPYIFEKLGQEVSVAWDQISNRWDTGKRAWQLHDPAASHHLVLLDDVILSRNLLAVLPKVIAGAPGQPISLFARNKKHWNPLIEQCLQDRRRVRWLVLQRLNWGPAVLLPTADIAPMLAWVDEHCHMPNYDVRIGYWYLTQRRPVWYTMPSLVDHRIEGDSLVWNLKSQANRYARFFIGEDNSGAHLTWHGKALVEPSSLESYLIKTAAINEKYRRAQL
jgi:hypothetical protein